MKRDIAYYRDKYEHGFLHYLRRCNYWETIESHFDSLAEAALNLARGFFGVLIGLPLLALRATLMWPIARVLEYHENKRELAELVKRDEARAALERTTKE